MGAVWTDDRRMAGWLEVELAATDAWAAEGVVPAEAAAACRERAAFTVEAVQERERTLDGVAVGKVPGAVGTYASIPPAVERRVVEALGLRAEEVSTQVIPRDRHAEFTSAIALAGAGLERLATEVRNLQRTEVGEV